MFNIVGIFPTQNYARPGEEGYDHELMQPSTPPLPTSPTALLLATRRLLRPLVHLMMRSGVTSPTLTDVLRRLFVDVAVTDLLTQPKARTDSRVSLLTGINRKEIRRYREMPP